ncbi:MAG: myo-inosose-2 dehydratase [Bacteroidetes bacterium]|nr:myo-inosose-2 dehydratase [Bacteroidota bacterium]
MMKKDTVRIGIAPIGWTNDDMPELGEENSFQQCVSEMALAGFSGCEVGNKYPSDPSLLKWHLDLRDLTICNQWFSSFLCSKPYGEVEKEFIKSIEFLGKVGAGIIGPSEQTRSTQGIQNVPILSSKAEFSREEWTALTKGMNKLGKIAVENGFKLAYHHHMGTGVQTAVETEQFLNDTHPDYVGLLYDSGHFAFAGEDPVLCLDRFVSRVVHVHLKDIRANIFETVRAKAMPFMDAVRAGVFTVPGDGCLDFSAIFSILEKYNYRGWMVVEAEQDPEMANPFEYALMARNYIRDNSGI